jgi:hypothetical protein
LPTDLGRHVSEHFVLATHADRDLAQAQLELLESTYVRFYASFRNAGFTPEPVGDRLIAVLFDGLDAYVQYATEADRVDMSWSNGYYSAKTNRVALVVAREDRVTHSDARQAKATNRDGQLLPFAESAADAEADLDQQGAKVDRLSVGVTMKPISIASTAHEAAHQLAFNSGLQRRGVMYPLWVSEGLASCFEPQALDDAFGPEHMNVNRHRDLVEAIDADALIALDKLVALTRLPTSDARAVTRVYAQGWALFHFLFKHHPQGLKAYLDSLAKLRPGRRSSGTMRREFIAAFGEIDALQPQWDAMLQTHRGAAQAVRSKLALNQDE